MGSGPYYYPYPPAVAVPVPVPAQPQEYVEQGQSGAAPAQAAAGQQGASWYYCDDSKTYYPYVKSCSSGWRPVPAQQSQGPVKLKTLYRKEKEMKYPRLALIASLSFLGACSVMPAGPSVMALPGTGKTFDQFRADDNSCRQFAFQQVGGVIDQPGGDQQRGG